MIKTLLTLLFVAASVAFSMHTLYYIQNNAYRPRLKYDNKAILEYFVLILLLVPMSILALKHAILSYIITLAILCFAIAYSLYFYNKKRTKFKLTSRGSRLLMTNVCLYAIAYSVASLIFFKPYSSILSYTIIFLATPMFTNLAAIIIFPFEKYNNEKYIKLAKERLAGLNAVKIGITGSFGKTSCKNILAAMLEKKYKVVKTASSFNTPMGICLTANGMSGDEEVFIAEMGAKRKGDISELCHIVNPTYAIITGVSNQHIETFKTQENIYQTKKELVDFLPQSGFAVFNGDNQGAFRMLKECNANVAIVHLNQAENGIYAKNIKLTNSGSTFTVVDGQDEISFNTKLLGRHNILNILMCYALACHLNVQKKDIVSAVEELSPIPHRLELVENSRGITIIDDSYNANIEGAAFALEVLNQFEGRKVLFTQGIVELGAQQHQANVDLGCLASSTADIVLLTGENMESISEGLEKGGFKGQIHRFKSFEDAKNSFSTLLMSGDILLIQNDIP